MLLELWAWPCPGGFFFGSGRRSSPSRVKERESTKPALVCEVVLAKERHGWLYPSARYGQEPALVCELLLASRTSLVQHHLRDQGRSTRCPLLRSTCARSSPVPRKAPPRTRWFGNIKIDRTSHWIRANPASRAPTAGLSGHYSSLPYCIGSCLSHPHRDVG